MMKFKMIAVDIDGTLTLNRQSTIIHLGVVEKLRILENTGVKVVLISSNALPVVIGLSKYFGFSGPCIGETGALIYYNREVIHLTEKSAFNAMRDSLNSFNEYVEESWQNLFRIHEFALTVKEKYRYSSREIYYNIKKYVESKYSDVKVGFSGYAIHLTPIDVSKGRALKLVMGILGIDKEESIGIGDSEMDLDFMEETGLKIAVADADEALIEKADIVLDKSGGAGVADFIDKLIRGEVSG